jgi:acyl-CoA dehydrogenase
VRDGDYYILNGQKTFITNGIFADAMIVACKVEDPDVDPKKNFTLICVEGDSLKNVHRQQLEKMGRHALDTAELFFEDCKVPVGNVLGKVGHGFKHMMKEFNRERLLVCIMCQAFAKEAFKEALNYAKVREAFGRPIGNFQHTAFELAKMATDVEIGTTFFNACVEEFVQGKENITMDISMAKSWLGEMVNRVAYKAVQIHGGYGYMAEYRVCRIYQDVRILSIFAGTTEIMDVIIARQLGLEPVF